MFSELSFADSPPKAAASRPLASFLRSLYALVSDAHTDDIVSWNAEGSSFIIHDVSRFASEILPQYYKHSNFSSFSRQLNFYSFKKVMDEDEEGGYLSVVRPNTFEYRHKYFVKGRPDLLFRVVRKTNATAIKELAAEEKADRLKRKRDELLMAQLSLAASLLSPGATAPASTSSAASTGAPNVPMAPVNRHTTARPAEASNPMASPLTALTSFFSQAMGASDTSEPVTVAGKRDAPESRSSDMLSALAALLSPAQALAPTVQVQHAAHSTTSVSDKASARGGAASFLTPPATSSSSKPLASPAAVSGASAGAAAAAERLRSAGFNMPVSSSIPSPAVWETSGAAAVPSQPSTNSRLGVPAPSRLNCDAALSTVFTASAPTEDRPSSNDSMSVREALERGQHVQDGINPETRAQLQDLLGTHKLLEVTTQGLKGTLQSLISSGATLLPGLAEQSQRLGSNPSSTFSSTVTTSQPQQHEVPSVAAVRAAAAAQVSGPAIAATLENMPHQLRVAMFLQLLLQNPSSGLSIPAGPLGSVPASSVLDIAQRMRMPVMNVLTALMRLQDSHSAVEPSSDVQTAASQLFASALIPHEDDEAVESDASSEQRKADLIIRTRRSAAMEARGPRSHGNRAHADEYSHSGRRAATSRARTHDNSDDVEADVATSAYDTNRRKRARRSSARIDGDDPTDRSMRRQWRPQSLDTVESPLGTAIKSMMSSGSSRSDAYVSGHSGHPSDAANQSYSLAVDTSLPAVAASLLSLGRDMTMTHHAFVSQHEHHGDGHRGGHPQPLPAAHMPHESQAILDWGQMSAASPALSVSFGISTHLSPMASQPVHTHTTDTRHVSSNVPGPAPAVPVISSSSAAAASILPPDESANLPAAWSPASLQRIDANASGFQQPMALDAQASPTAFAMMMSPAGLSLGAITPMLSGADFSGLMDRPPDAPASRESQTDDAAAARTNRARKLARPFRAVAAAPPPPLE